MNLEEIKLINFRNYKQLHLKLHPKLNIFIGENAQGKTNILEAIYLCAIGKSFRTNKDQEMIQILKSQGYIKVKVNKIQEEVNIEVKLDVNTKKSIKLNQAPITKLGELLGNLNVVLFSPEDLKIIKEGPEERRRFLDSDISQISPKYYYILSQYNRILQQRNKLLKNEKIKPVDMEIWDEQLSEYGTSLIIYRRNFIRKMSILAKLAHRKITEGIEILDIYYKNSLKIAEDSTVEEIKLNFKEKLKNSLTLDRQKGYTSIGPHRDDLLFKINGVDVKHYGSQGQQRTVVLSLKLAELEVIKGEVGEYPILLLDDVMSELDIKRQSYLIENLRYVQTFITTAVLNQFSIENVENRSIFTVSKGEVRKTH